MQWMMQTDDWRRIEAERWDEVRAATEQARLLRRAHGDGAGWTERLTFVGRLFAKRPLAAVEPEPVVVVPASSEADSMVIEIERVRKCGEPGVDDLWRACLEEAG